MDMDNCQVVAETKYNTVVSRYIPLPRNSTAYQSEAELEAEFIKMLTEQGYGAPKIKSERALIENLRECLEELNKYQFSDSEWARFFESCVANRNEGIVDKTRKIQDFDTAQLLYRDDGTTKNIRLVDKNVSIITNFKL